MPARPALPSGRSEGHRWEPGAMLSEHFRPPATHGVSHAARRQWSSVSLPRQKPTRKPYSAGRSAALPRPTCASIRAARLAYSFARSMRSRLNGPSRISRASLRYVSAFSNKASGFPSFTPFTWCIFQGDRCRAGLPRMRGKGTAGGKAVPGSSKQGGDD